ncbi:MAG: HAD family phosphatase [Planctomycetota bacterium]|nr:MAG: HAD family phosphatase [Planctomycetota bacterium]
MPKIRFLYFDLGRVLINFDVDRMCRQMAEVSGVAPDAVYRVVFEDGIQHDYEVGRISTAEFYDRYCKALDCRPPQDRLIEAAADIFWPNLDTLPILAGLLAARAPLGILSNTCHIHWEHCRRRFSILDGGYRAFVLSYQARASKPDPKIFATAIEQAGVSPDEIFFVDDLPQHVEGATRAGLTAVQYTDAGRLARDLHNLGVCFNY